MYHGDNNEVFVSNPGWTDGMMDWGGGSDNIDADKMLSGAMGLYIKAKGVFKCPGDKFKSPSNPGDRVRSVSMNGAVGTARMHWAIIQMAGDITPRELRAWGEAQLKRPN